MYKIETQNIDKNLKCTNSVYKILRMKNYKVYNEMSSQFHSR